MMKNLFIKIIPILLILSSCEEGYYDDSIDNSPYRYNDYYDNGSDEQYNEYGENEYVLTSTNPVTTFAIDADGASYANIRRLTNLQQPIPSSAIRVEEFINYFMFDYQEPTGENVSIETELSTCPWNDSEHLLRIGLKGKSLDQNELPPSNYVFLIDVSGSMSAPEKLELLKTGFTQFVDEIDAQDRIAIVTYAGSAGVALESTSGENKETIKNAIAKLQAGGSTAGAQGILTAYQIAGENYIENGNNRVILGTDGDFNVGTSSQEELVELIEEKRDNGIYLTILGVGTGNLNEAMMEQVANNGNGNYEYIDNAEQMKKVFVYEKSKFFTVAKDCKIQIDFNEENVYCYRLIGYENRALDNDQFDDDEEDAGEIGAGQTITALYQLQLVNSEGNNLGKISFRYKKPGTETSNLIEFDANLNPVSFSSASENTRFSASVAAFGMKLKGSYYAGNASYTKIYNWATDAISFDPHGFRAEFLELVNVYRELK